VALQGGIPTADFNGHAQGRSGQKVEKQRRTSGTKLSLWAIHAGLPVDISSALKRISNHHGIGQVRDGGDHELNVPSDSFSGTRNI